MEFALTHRARRRMAELAGFWRKLDGLRPPPPGDSEKKRLLAPGPLPLRGAHEVLRPWCFPGGELFFILPASLTTPLLNFASSPSSNCQMRAVPEMPVCAVPARRPLRWGQGWAQLEKRAGIAVPEPVG